MSDRRCSTCRRSSRMRTPSVVVSAKMIFVICDASLRPRQHRQHHPGTALLHLHRRPEHIERAFGEQSIHHVAENLRIQIVEIRFKHRDNLGRDSSRVGQAILPV